MNTIRPTFLFRDSQDFLTFAPEQVVFQEGQPGDFMYAVIEGEIEIFINGKFVEAIGPDGIFGEMALIDKASRSGTAKARVESKLVPIDQLRFSFMVQHNPYFALHIMHLLADRLRRQTQC